MSPHCFEEISQNMSWRTPVLLALKERVRPESQKSEDYYRPFLELDNAHNQSKGLAKV